MKNKTILLFIILIIIIGTISITAQDERDIIIGEKDGEIEELSDRLAIVIGVNNYINISDLKYAEADALLIKEVLEEKGVFTVQFYSTNSGGQNPSKEKIYEALEDVNYLAKNGIIKTFLFYFAGHGFNQDASNYIAPMEISSKDISGTGISLDKVLNIVNEIQKYSKVMIFLDACRNEPGSRGGGGSFSDQDSRGLGIFYSTKLGDYSYEIDDIGHGVYTYFLYEGLNGFADEDNNGLVSFNEITKYVTYKMVEWSSKNPDKSQKPRVTSIEKFGEFYITLTENFEIIENEEDAENNTIIEDAEEITENSIVLDIPYRDLIYIPGGEYKRINVQNENSEIFSHQISPYWISKYEVTYQLWYKVYYWAMFKGYQFESKGKDGSIGGYGTPIVSFTHYPVTTISWRDAIVWCNAYSELNGYQPVYYSKNGEIIRNSTVSWGNACDNAVPDWDANGYRLPTEGEWFYAASEGGNTAYNYASGAEDDYRNSYTTGNVAWYSNNSNGKAHDVGTKLANSFGLYDMSGNVSEWCWDWYDDLPENPTSDYYGPESSILGKRVFLGGDWHLHSEYLQIGYRFKANPESMENWIGFRLVRSNF